MLLEDPELQRKKIGSSIEQKWVVWLTLKGKGVNTAMILRDTLTTP